MEDTKLHKAMTECNDHFRSLAPRKTSILRTDLAQVNVCNIPYTCTCKWGITVYYLTYRHYLSRHLNPDYTQCFI